MRVGEGLPEDGLLFVRGRPGNVVVRRSRRSAICSRSPFRPPSRTAACFSARSRSARSRSRRRSRLSQVRRISAIRPSPLCSSSVFFRRLASSSRVCDSRRRFSASRVSIMRRSSRDSRSRSSRIARAWSKKASSKAFRSADGREGRPVFLFEDGASAPLPFLEGNPVEVLKLLPERVVYLLDRREDPVGSGATSRRWASRTPFFTAPLSRAFLARAGATSKP